MLSSQTPLVSVIVDTFYRPGMLKHAIQCLRQQTYGNLEIVIVNNGATAETISYLTSVAAIEPRIKLVHFETNQFSWDDPMMMVRVCYNAGLKVATGELVFHQADDDWVASDFVERMVALFLGNPACTTAIGRCVSALPDGSHVATLPAARGTYIDGLDLSLDYMNGRKKIRQTDPGFCFVMQRSELVDLGGFHSDLETQQYFSIVPFGVTGYDPDALMYWRRHELQLNKIGNSRGVFWGDYTEQFLADTKNSVISRWKAKFGEPLALDLERYLLGVFSRDYFRVIAHRLFSFRWPDALRFFIRFFNSPAKRRITWANFASGGYSGMTATPLGRMLPLSALFFKGMLRNPFETMKKVLRRIVSADRKGS
jgi:glycosyltransferase involved in cell wall biosynthesis